MGKNIPDFTLDHPRVQRLKRRYERNHIGKRSACKLSFDEIFIALKTDESFGSICRRAGLAEGSLKHKLDRYFGEVVGYKDGKSRRSRIAFRRQFVRKVIASKQPPEHPRLKQVALRALEFGCSVEQVVFMRPNNPSVQWVNSRRLRINWVVCAIYHVSTLTRIKGTQRYYWSATVNAGLGMPAVIRATAKGRSHFFVLPAELIQSWKSDSSTRNSISLHLSEDKRITKMGPSRATGVWNYEDAWHLLKPSDVQEQPPT